MVRECHDCPLGRHFCQAKMGLLVLSLDFWVGQDVDVAEYVRTCQTCQRTKAEHGGQRGLLHALPLHSMCGGMIGVDWIAWLPTTEGWFNIIQNHNDLLSGKVHAVSTRVLQQRQMLQRSFATSASGLVTPPGRDFPTCWWWFTTPSSLEGCSWPSSRAWAHA
jgi:hypothetical protein